MVHDTDMHGKAGWTWSADHQQITGGGLAEAEICLLFREKCQLLVRTGFLMVGNESATTAFGTAITRSARSEG